MEEENAKTFYEVEMMVNGHSKDILMDSKGEIVQVEEEVATAELTSNVKAGLLTKAGTAKNRQNRVYCKEGSTSSL
jgi:hypothetical protein